VVFWRIADAGQYLFNLADPDQTIKVAAEAVMREIIGQTRIQTALTEGRQSIQVSVRQKLQELLDEYKAGVRVREVQLLAVDPPSDVIDAFNDVQRARQDRDRLKNEAEAFRNDVVPRARGEAARLVAEAEAYREEVVSRAEGDASRFDQVYSAYEVDKDVTRERIYIETIEEVFGNIEKIIIDEDGNSVVPYLPLKELGRNSNSNQGSN
jgi:membrane protease subunit HflK